MTCSSESWRTSKTSAPKPCGATTRSPSKSRRANSRQTSRPSASGAFEAVRRRVVHDRGGPDGKTRRVGEAADFGEGRPGGHESGEIRHAPSGLALFPPSRRRLEGDHEHGTRHAHHPRPRSEAPKERLRLASAGG